MSHKLERINTVEALRARIKPWRLAGETIGFVPTMGNLHGGHLELVREVKQRADRCVASIFVNPMQFGEKEDFGSYPRTLEEDAKYLADAKVDLLFAPSVDEIYPQGDRRQTQIVTPGLSDILCGASRPGHFVGVATVVCKLFNMVQPDLAVFGEKDFQQLLVIRRMVDELAIPVKVIGVATVREADGLAKSSRNSYLTPAERLSAPLLYQSLRRMKDKILAGADDYLTVEAEGRKFLENAGFKVDYLTVRRSVDLGLPRQGGENLVILAAAHLGRTRLIDNLAVRE